MVEEVNRPIFVAADGKEFLTREDAEKHEQDIVLTVVREWLADQLYEAGGAHYDFSIDEAALWVLKNYDLIGEKLRAALSASTPNGRQT